MNELKEITEAIIKFRDDRNWSQFHNAKDLAIAISIESGELLQAFLWKSPAEAKDQKIREELADIFIYAMLLAHEKGIDIKEIVLNKIEENGKKYPIDKFKGLAKKYNEI